MALKFSDLIEDCAIEMNDPDFSVFSVDEWKRYIDSTQHETYPRLFRRQVHSLDTVDDVKEYDLSDVSPAIREIDELYLYDDSSDTKPRRIVDWDWDQTQEKLRLRISEGADDVIKVLYTANLMDLDEDTDTLDLNPEARTLIKKLAVRAALTTLLNDRNKLEKYRTTVDDQVTPYTISNTINMYDRSIEMRLREIKELLTPARVKKPYREYVDVETPQYYIEHGD